MDPVSKSRQTQDGANTAKNSKRGLRPPWPKGVSGNPSGRPKKKPITEMYEEVLNDPRSREEIKERIFQTLKGKGMAGVLERREAADRVEGKVAQIVDVDATLHVTLEQVLEAKKKAGK